MTASVQLNAEPRTRATPALVLAVPLYAATLFVSAAMLFSVQPMFAKLVVPILGGSPSVWSVAMVFFQAILLAGYAYAHLLTRYCTLRTALASHLTLMMCALLLLPVTLPHGWGRPPQSGEAIWLLGLFSATIGLPFLAVSANGPLLQAWFARSGHRNATDPYFLYAASNVGSFAALLLYPIAIEPWFTLHGQSQGWTAGFIALAGLIAACGVLVTKSSRPAASRPTLATAEARVSWRERGAWICLSLVPSGLLVSVTAHISTDVAAVPLLWVAPLAMFLLTFVLAFRDRPFIPTRVLIFVQVASTAVTLATIPMTLPLWISLPLHLGTFFVTTLLCHSALYARRPAADRLTEFYFYMSLGGVLGGAFCGLLAPRLFSTVLEYPILLAAALFCRPAFFAGPRKMWVQEGGGVALIWAALVAAGYLFHRQLFPTAPQSGEALRLVLLVMISLSLTITWRSPHFIAAPAIVGVLIASVLSFGSERVETVRSFFGVNKLTKSVDGRFLILSHGTTIHGAARIRNDDGSVVAGRPEPATYYTYDGAIGTVISSVRAAHQGNLGSVAAIGLGAGSLACHAAPAESWTFLEIDPAVAELARNPQYFRFLSECAPDAAVVLGDARLTIADQASGIGLVIVDAFSSDAIPAHLITKEALAVYLSKLSPTGSILVHISNRHLDLSRILARTAAEHGLQAYLLKHTPEEPFKQRLRSPSVVVVLTRDRANLGPIPESGMLKRLEPEMARKPWTDDFSNIVQAIADNNGW